MKLPPPPTSVIEELSKWLDPMIKLVVLFPLVRMSSLGIKILRPFFYCCYYYWMLCMVMFDKPAPFPLGLRPGLFT